MFVGIIGLCIGMLLINAVVDRGNGSNTGNNGGNNESLEYDLSVIKDKEPDKVTVLNIVILDNNGSKDEMLKNMSVEQPSIPVPEMAKEQSPMNKTNVTIGEEIIIEEDKSELLK